MPLTPEQRARELIDALLSAAGWVIQDNATFNRNAAQGVAVREFVLPNGPCDYLLFVGGKAAGVVEAKKAGVTLSGVAEQASKYIQEVPAHLARWHDKLRFDYESTGDETYFRDTHDPKPRSRRVFAFHRPEALHRWLKEHDTFRGRVQRLTTLDVTGLRDCQIEAVNGLETSLAKDHPRSLIQMATEAGKTFTACTFSWRLLKHAKATRILFLVDRNNLGDQTLKEYQNYEPPGSDRKFVQTYIVQHLHGSRIDPDAKVVGADTKVSHFQAARLRYGEPVRASYEPRNTCESTQFIWLTGTAARRLNLRPAPTMDAQRGRRWPWMALLFMPKLIRYLGLVGLDRHKKSINAS